MGGLQLPSQTLPVQREPWMASGACRTDAAAGVNFFPGRGESVVCVPDSEFTDRRHNDPLGPCPRCGSGTWWNQTYHTLGPFQREPT